MYWQVCVYFESYFNGHVLMISIIICFHWPHSCINMMSISYYYYFVCPKWMKWSIDRHINQNKIGKNPKGSNKRWIYQHRHIYQGEKVLQWGYGPLAWWFAFSILSQHWDGTGNWILRENKDLFIRYPWSCHQVNSPHKGQWHGALMCFWSAPK